MTSYYYSISIDDTYGLFFLEILLAMQNWMYNIIQLGHKMKMNLLIPCESKFEKFVFLSVRPSVGRSIRSSVIRPSVSMSCVLGKTMLGGSERVWLDQSHSNTHPHTAIHLPDGSYARDLHSTSAKFCLKFSLLDYFLLINLKKPQSRKWSTCQSFKIFTLIGCVNYLRRLYLIIGLILI